MGIKTVTVIGVTVNNNISICEECTVGAAAAVIEDINEKGI